MARKNVLSVLLLLLSVQVERLFVQANFVLDVRLQSYNNPNNTRNRNGQCCDLDNQTAPCIDPCDVLARFEIYNYETGDFVQTQETAVLGSDTTLDLTSSSFRFTGTASQLHMNTHPPISFTLQFEVVDEDGDGPSGDDVIIRRQNFTRAFTVGSDPVLFTQVRPFANISFAYQVTCADNFFGELCSVECVEMGNFTCDSDGNRMCLPNHGGENCNLTGCAAKLCMNGVTCLDLDEPVGTLTYQCTCNSGFYGLNCEIDPCNPNPCENAGTCMRLERVAQNVRRHMCMCAPGWTDVNCTTNINGCEPNPCQNGGNCTDLVNDYQCDCKQGFSGESCEMDACTEEPCMNGGNCTVLENGDFNCSCTAEWTGDTCEEDVNECDSSPCESRRNCTNLIGGHRCECVAGYTGQNCEIDVDGILLSSEIVSLRPSPTKIGSSAESKSQLGDQLVWVFSGVAVVICLAAISLVLTLIVCIQCKKRCMKGSSCSAPELSLSPMVTHAGSVEGEHVDANNGDVNGIASEDVGTGSANPHYGNPQPQAGSSTTVYQSLSPASMDYVSMYSTMTTGTPKVMEGGKEYCIIDKSKMDPPIQYDECLNWKGTQKQ